MTEFRARICRVRMKNGGADVRVIEGFALPRDETIEATALREVRECVEAGELTTFLFLGISAEGRCHFAFRYGDGGPISRSLLPSYVEELTRSQVVTRNEASRIFNDMFEWREG